MSHNVANVIVPQHFSFKQSDCNGPMMTIAFHTLSDVVSHSGSDKGLTMAVC